MTTDKTTPTPYDRDLNTLAPDKRTDPRPWRVLELERQGYLRALSDLNVTGPAEDYRAAVERLMAAVNESCEWLATEYANPNGHLRLAVSESIKNLRRAIEALREKQA